MNAKFFIFSSLLIAIALGCEADEYNIRVEKCTKAWAQEESYKILYNNAVMAVSEEFTNNAVRSYYHCIPKEASGRYTLNMLDEADSWSPGAYIRIIGPEGQLLFIGTMTQQKSETHDFYMGYMIENSSTWKIWNKSDPATNWKSADFDDSEWTSYTGRTSVNKVGTVYARKRVNGLSGMAAYELTWYVQYGVIVYINGREVRRINMPSGTVSADTPCNDKEDYRTLFSVIRNGLEIEGDSVVVAMEYHYEDNTSSHTFYMSTFLAPYLSSMGDSCYQSYEDHSITSNSQKEEEDTSGPRAAFDLNVNSAWAESNYNYYVDVEWSNCIPQINGFMIDVRSSRTLHPSSFTLRGYPPNDGTSDLMVSKVDYEYPNNNQNFFALPLNEKIYKKIRMQITKTQSSGMRLNEMALLTCRYAVPDEMKFTEEDLKLNAFVDSVRVGPTYDGFVSCSSNPTLPAGLSLNYQTCMITGTPREVQEEKTYTITAQKPQPTTSVIKITVSKCDKTIVEVERTYGALSFQYETHALLSLDGKAVERVYQNSVQKGGQTIKNRYCVEPGQYELTMDNTISTYWQADSFIKVNLVYEMDTVTIYQGKYDLTSGYSPSVILNLAPEIPRGQQWSYAMGEVPEDWNSAEAPEGWETAKKGEFPESTNQLQFYKRSFTSVAQPMSGYELEIMYTHGVIVLINGVEVFRNNVQGNPTNETYATDAYSATKYRRITLPVLTPPNTQVIKSGANVISICLVAKTASQRAATFDASLRVMGRESVGRAFDFTASTSDSSANAPVLFDMGGQTIFTSSVCGEGRYAQVTFNDDRREWINKYSIVNSYEKDKANPHSWVFQAKNEKDDDWTTLHTVNSTDFWYLSQNKEIFLSNVKAYNMYRIFNLKGASETECEVNIAEIGLFSSKVNYETPAITFNGNNVGYLNVDFENLVPATPFYSGYRIQPALPAFLSLDEVTGYVRGSDMTLMDPVTYTVTANTLVNTEVTGELTLSVIECDKSMVELTILTDSYPNEMGYELYSGNKAEGEPIRSVTDLGSKNSYQYKYFCLEKGIYTFKFMDSYGDGWAAPAGYRIMSPNYLTYAEGTLPRGDKPNTKVVTFSNIMPIPTKSADWYVLKSQVKGSWTSVKFDHSKWTKMAGGSVGTMDSNTIYLRHLITIDDIINTPTLNVQVKFTGGAAAYLNGVRVFRSNLPSDIAFDTAATESHPPYSFSQFSIPLQLKGGQNGQNVLAIELHRKADEDEKTDSGFDVEAVLAYGDCGVVRSTVKEYLTSPTVRGSGYGLFDGTMWNFLSWDWQEGTFAEWKYENMDGVFFNKYRIYGDGNPGSVSFIFKSKKEGDKAYTTFDSHKAATIPDRSFFETSTPNGIIGYQDFRLEFMSVQRPSGFTIDEIELAYCASSGNMCPGVGEFPSVAAGEISVAKCPEFYDGYSYRECTNGRLGEVKLDHCSKFPPSGMEFAEPKFTVYVNAEVTGIKPTVFGLVDDYQILPELPAGLSFDTKTGTVYGKPMNVTTRLVTYTVTGYNENGSTSGTFQLSVITGYCDPEDEWPRTPIGETVEFDCKELGANYVGTLKRTCKLGKNAPEWGMEIGFCMALGSFIAMGVLLVIVVIIVIIAVIKVTSDKKKAKARTGVRGGKKAMNIMKSVPYAKI